MTLNFSQKKTNFTSNLLCDLKAITYPTFECVSYLRHGFKLIQSENKAMALLREKTELQSQLDENEEDYNDVMKKYKAVVQQASLDQNLVSQQSQQIEELSTDRERLKQEVRGTPGGYSID